MLCRALAGPGPATLALRAGAGALAHLVAAPADAGRTLRHGSSTSTDAKRRPRFAKAKPPRAKPGRASAVVVEVERATQSTRTKPAAPPLPPPSPGPPIEYAVRLPPPCEPEHAVRYLSALTTALAELRRSHVIRAWANLELSHTVPLVPASLWPHLSRFVADFLEPRGTQNVGELARAEPETFGHLRGLALDAAARDEHAGLLALALGLLEAGRPNDVVRALDDYRVRYRAAHGMDKADLSSPIRERRVAARIDTEGSRLLALAYLAAMAMLGPTTDGAARMLAALDFSPRVGVARRHVRAVEQRLRASATRAGRRSGPALAPDELVGAFRRLLANTDLAMRCHHPREMNSRIAALTNAREYGRLRSLYDELMEASIGPHRFIQPRDLADTHTRYFDVVPLTFNIWEKFIVAFHASGDHDRLVRMIDHDMPARGLTPTPQILAAAMLGHSWLARGAFPAQVRARSRARAEALWDRLIATGDYLDDHAVAARIVVLRDAGRRDTAYELYAEAGAAARAAGRTTPQSDAAYVEIATSAGDMDRAMAAFGAELAQADAAHWARLAFRAVRAVAADRWWPPARRTAVLRQVIAAKPPTVRLNSETRGLVLAIMLRERDAQPETSLAPLVAAALDGLGDPSSGSSVTWWLHFMPGLVSRKTQPGAAQLRAAVLTLEAFKHRSVRDATPTRVRSLWSAVLAAVVRAPTDALSEQARTELVQRALDAFADGPGEGNVDPALRAAIIRDALARDDAAAIPLAVDQWQLCRASAPPALWTSMLAGLSKHDFAIAAREVCTDAVAVRGVKRARGMGELWAKAAELGVISPAEVAQLLARAKVAEDSSAAARAAEAAAVDDTEEADEATVYEDDAEDDEVGDEHQDEGELMSAS